MQKVRGSRRAGVQRKKKCARSLDKMEEKKRGKWRRGREKNGGEEERKMEEKKREKWRRRREKNGGRRYSKY